MMTRRDRGWEGEGRDEAITSADCPSQKEKNCAQNHLTRSKQMRRPLGAGKKKKRHKNKKTLVNIRIVLESLDRIAKSM